MSSCIQREAKELLSKNSHNYCAFYSILVISRSRDIFSMYIQYWNGTCLGEIIMRHTLTLILVTENTFSFFFDMET